MKQIDPETHLNQGRSLFEAANYKEAKAEFELALAIDSENAETNNWLGRVAYAQERYKEAEKAFRRASGLNPKEPAYRYNIGLALRYLELFAEAEREFRAALFHDKDYILAQTGLGELFFEQSRYDEAEKAFRKAIDLDNNSADAQRYLGSLLTYLERYDEAEVHLTQAVKLNNYNAVNYLELAGCFFRQKKYSKAIRIYRQATILEKENLDAQIGLTLSLIMTERFDEAENQIRPLLEPGTAVKIKSNEVWIIHQTLADLFTCIGEKRGDDIYYEEAAAAVEKALSGAPDDHKAELYFKRGIINSKLKHYDAARKDFEECLRLDKTHWSAKRNKERLQAYTTNQKSKILERFSPFLTLLATIQLISLWIVFITSEKINIATFAVLAPLLFALVLVSLLIPQLTKI